MPFSMAAAIGNAYSPLGGGGGGSGGAPSQLAGQSGTYITPGMGGIYDHLLGLNTSNYGNTINAYQQTQANLSNQLSGIPGGYDNLYRGIVGTLGLGGNGWGVATPAANAIGDQFAKSRGEITGNMIRSGLGNSTVAANLQNQNSYLASRAYGELGNQLAGTAAGYAAQIGQAQMGAAQQAAGMQSQLGAAFGNALAGYKFGNTAGDLTGQFGYHPPQGGGGGGGHGGGGGGSSGYGGQSFLGGIPGAQTAWGGAGGGNYYGSTPAFNNGGMFGGLGNGRGGGGFDNSLYDYDPGGNFGGAFLGGGIDFGNNWYGDSGGGGEF